MSPRKDPAAVALGRKGGSANTPAQAAARAQPKGGGRPTEPRSPSDLYWSPTLPDAWVVWDPAVEALVMFPARANGWAARAPYLGHVRSLRLGAAWGAIGTGWPGK